MEEIYRGGRQSSAMENQETAAGLQFGSNLAFPSTKHPPSKTDTAIGVLDPIKSTERRRTFSDVGFFRVLATGPAPFNYPLVSLAPPNAISVNQPERRRGSGYFVSGPTMNFHDAPFPLPPTPENRISDVEQTPRLA
jgi:hypothetical protein